VRCFFEGWPGAGPCDGALVRAHLVPRQLLKREFPHGASWQPREERWVNYWPLEAQDAALNEERWAHRSLRALMDDPRCWVPCCGGPMGNGGHHGMLDQSRRLRIPRERLPAEVEEFAAELNLSWWLDREYGSRVAA
jgi:hypothetical protein